MGEPMTVEDAMRYINMAGQSIGALSEHSDDAEQIVISVDSANVAIACLMKFKDIFKNASVFLQ